MPARGQGMPTRGQGMSARGQGMSARGQGMRPGPSGHVPAPLVPGRFGQGMRPGGFPSDTPRSWVPAGDRSDQPGGRSASSTSDISRGQVSSGDPGSSEPSNMDRSLDSITRMRATSRTDRDTSSCMLSSITSRCEPVPSLRETRLQRQRCLSTSFGQGYSRSLGSNKRKRLGENLDAVTDTSRWVKAFKKRPNTAASEEPAAATNSTQTSGQDPHQGGVVKSEVDVLIPATSTGLTEVPSSAPTPIIKSESLIEEPILCPEPQNQIKIELANTAGTGENEKADVVLEMPSRPKPRCPLRPNCKHNECVPKQPRSDLATSSFLCAKSKITVGESAIQSETSSNCCAPIPDLTDADGDDMGVQLDDVKFNRFRKS